MFIANHHSSLSGQDSLDLEPFMPPKTGHYSSPISSEDVEDEMSFLRHHQQDMESLDVESCLRAYTRRQLANHERLADSSDLIVVLEDSAGSIGGIAIAKDTRYGCDFIHDWYFLHHLPTVCPDRCTASIAPCQYPSIVHKLESSSQSSLALTSKS